MNKGTLRHRPGFNAMNLVKSYPFLGYIAVCVVGRGTYGNIGCML
jgi:hypothetical protein